jgi:hypothetical protein
MAHKLYPVGIDPKWPVALEKLPKGLVALHQREQRVVIVPADLYRIATAVSYWQPPGKAT